MNTATMLPVANEMTEEAFLERLTKSLVVLSTSSGDKIAHYTALFSALESGENDRDRGINCYFTHMGAFGIANHYVAEVDGDTKIHANKKLARAMKTMVDNKAHISNKLRQGTIEHPEDVELVSMVEDSAWNLDFSAYTQEQKNAFLLEAERLLQEKIRQQDWQVLLQNLDITKENATFPGADLKPIQEHLEGGFVELMQIIYDAADKVGMKELRYISSIDVAFGFENDGAIFNYSGEAKGRILTREEFEKALENMPLGLAVTSDTVHVPDGQVGKEKTFDRLNDNILITSSRDVSADHARRNFAEWLQTHIGAREFSEKEKLRQTKIAYLSPSSLENGAVLEREQHELLRILESNDFSFTTIPTYEELKRFPSIKMLDGADVLLVEAEEMRTYDGITIDPNLSMLCYLAVTVQVDPQSVNVPIILDNRHGQWDATLELFREMTKKGSLLGDFSFVAANYDEELKLLLKEYSAITKQSTIAPKSEEITPIPQDGKMSVFVAGGHANNNKRDKEQAYDLGYYLASQDIRIVTGGGQLDGSMGAVHTGFVQYHLDNLHGQAPNALNENMQKALRDANFDAETLIMDRPDVINALADAGFIPADMFFSYSTEDLMKIESPNGELETAGVTHQNVANRLLRLDYLLSADVSVIMPGGTGTYEEIDVWIRTQIESKMQLPTPANDNYSPDQKIMIIHNLDGFFDPVLKRYGLLAENGEYNKAAMDSLHIKIVHDPIELKENIETTPRYEVTHGMSERLELPRLAGAGAWR